MKQLIVPFVNAHLLNRDNGLRIESLPLPQHTLAYVPWPDYPYRPDVKFNLAHAKDCLVLKFVVEEHYLRYENRETNSTVWEDSCVEFFVRFNGNGAYYNIEFNCIGTGIIGYGESKENRQLLPAEVVKSIKVESEMEELRGSYKWQLTLYIPFAVFVYDEIETLQNREAYGNFYKCGDLMPEPHFLAWSNVEYPEPNFHLPASFGRLHFSS